ncbi:MAG: Maf family protein [Thermodesulfobacteriota bacterium]
MDDDAPPRGPFRNKRPLILASASPRRQDLLARLGIHFFTHPCSQAEPSPSRDEAPEDYVLRCALFKARHVAHKRPDRPVLGADTAVTLDHDILGKPQNAQEALMTLQRLSGVEHTVITGCALVDPDTHETHTLSAESTVRIGVHPLDVLQAYVASGEPLDKAGSYAIQGVGGFLVDSVCGSYTNVVGLPLYALTQLLQRTGIITPTEIPCSAEPTQL